MNPAPPPTAPATTTTYTCPNTSNKYHECTDYCRETYDPNYVVPASAPKAITIKSAPGINSTGDKIPESKLTYSDDRFLGNKLPSMDTLLWLQGEDEAREALASEKIKCILFWAKFPKGNWIAIQQFEKLKERHPDVAFFGISCDTKWQVAEEMMAHAHGGDHKDINLYKFNYSFPAAFDPERVVNASFRKLGGLSSLAAGNAFILDKSNTIVWREVIDMSVIASSGDPGVCMKYWNRVLPDNQFPDQLRLLIRSTELISNGPRPEDDDDEEEEICGEMAGGDEGAFDPFADDDGTGDY